MTRKYEYYNISDIKKNDLSTIINSWTKDSWELITVTENSVEFYTLFFKRKLKTSQLLNEELE
ncbi:MAG: hypothetical protein WD512_06390 [Candidatus Paceibacterota bacterium]